MRFARFFVMVIALLYLVPFTFADQPEVGVIYFRPSDRTAPSNIDSKIDTLVKAAQTAYGDEMVADGYTRKTFEFEENGDGTVKVNHVTGDHDDAHYLTADGWDIWAEITTAGYDQSENIYIAFLDFSSNTVDGGWCGTGGDYLDGGLGGVVNMAIASDCFDGDHGTAILVHELGHAFGLRHDYRNHPDYNIDLTDNDPMVTSDCATKWLDAHPYFNDYSTTPSGSTTITMSTPSISGSNVTVTFTITDDDSLHQAHFFETITESYGFDDLSLLDCDTLSGTSDTATFTTSELTSATDSVSIRVMDALGRTTEKKFTVDLSALPDTVVDNSNNGGDGSVNTTPLSLQGIADNFGQLGPNTADINGDGVVNIQDLVLAAGAVGNDAAAPSVGSRNSESMPTRAEVQAWLREAREVNLKDPEFQRGILALEQLLLALTPKASALLPNYPNPFNPETWIPYRLAKPADTNISIYSVKGHLVRSLDLGHQAVGIYESRSHAAYWDGKNALGETVASGVYFYVLTAGDFTATRKMLILK